VTGKFRARNIQVLRALFVALMTLLLPLAGLTLALYESTAYGPPTLADLPDYASPARLLRPDTNAGNMDQLFREIEEAISPVD